MQIFVKNIEDIFYFLVFLISLGSVPFVVVVVGYIFFF